MDELMNRQMGGGTHRRRDRQMDEGVGWMDGGSDGGMD